MTTFLTEAELKHLREVHAAADPFLESVTVMGGDDLLPFKQRGMANAALFLEAFRHLPALLDEIEASRTPQTTPKVDNA